MHLTHLGVQEPIEQEVWLIRVCGTFDIRAAHPGVSGIPEVVPWTEVSGTEADGAQLGREGQAGGQTRSGKVVRKVAVIAVL